MFDRIKQIIETDTNNLPELMRAAGGDAQTFWIGADLAGLDLRGQDLRKLNFQHTKLDGAIIDNATQLPLSASRTAKLVRLEAETHSKPPAPPRGMSSRIAPHIPYLRRYARALSGSQARGDSYVAAVLEQIIADPGIIQLDESVRVSLYKAFSNLWQSVTVDPRQIDPVSAWEERTALALSGMPLISRQAFLLIAVEGFSKTEGAAILNVGEDEFSRLIEEAASDIGHQVSTKILIIEDEPIIAMDLEQMMEGIGHEVTGIARTYGEAMSLFAEHQPGMILADIQLADGTSGLDAVNDIFTQTKIPTIFITAFPERLLQGDRPEPTFLITKPFNPDMVKALVSQALFFEHNGSSTGVS